MAPLSPATRQGLQESSMTLSASSRAPADSALAVYLEPHAEGRRVLLLGDARGALADRLDALAQQLEIIDPAAREPSRGEVPELPFDDRSFDLVLVCDVTTLPEPLPDAARELRRVLDKSGLLVVLSPPEPRRRRRGPPAHVQLEGLLRAEFRNVRLLAQTPLAGFALGERERKRGEEFAVDSSLVRDQQAEPERMLALASEARLAIEPRLWVEVPVEDTAASGGDGAAQSALLEELRRVEDEAREALHRESDLLRKLEVERRARTEAEQVAERARTFERKLLAAEADYDDAVARVRYLESVIGEHEAASQHDRERREAAEHELARAKSELAAASEKLSAIEAERSASRSDAEAATREIAQLEQRLAELGKQLLTLQSDKAHHETIARDLLEELRRHEQQDSVAVEHDARVAELEAERDRAVQRALEAEVAREAAQMRTDELRSELTAQQGELHALMQRPARPEPASAERATDQAELAPLRAELARYRGECQGLRLRLNDAELALGAATPPSEQLCEAVRELDEVRLRLAHTDALLHAMREATQPARLAQASGLDRERVRELEEQLAQADQRLAELSRELEEADRFAELHAEDAERLSSVEAELESSRDRLESLEDELRSLEHEVSATRDDLSRERDRAEQAAREAATRLELVERREAERDDARAALAEARSILSQLAGRVGADENDPPSIVQAFLARDDSRSGVDRELDTLRTQLADRDRRIAQLEQLVASPDQEAPPVPLHGDAPEY